MRRPPGGDHMRITTASFTGLLITAVTLGLSAGTAPADAADSLRGSQHATQQLRTPVRGTLASLPPIVQPGTTPAKPSDDGTLVATFDPADPGNKVTLERQGRRGWKPVATGTEDAWGSAAFSPGPG